METLQMVVQHPLTQGAFGGLVAAVSVDYGAFRQWKSFDEAKTYDWKVARWRWLQGLVSGSVGGAGLLLAQWGLS